MGSDASGMTRASPGVKFKRRWVGLPKVVFVADMPGVVVNARGLEEARSSQLTQEEVAISLEFYMHSPWPLLFSPG